MCGPQPYGRVCLLTGPGMPGPTVQLILKKGNYSCEYPARHPRKRYRQRGCEPWAIGPVRLRDMGGIIVVDFIDMNLAEDRQLLYERMCKNKLNRSAVELGYSALVVSNFTLYGDTSRGKRPSFIHAARGELAVPCYEKFLEEMSHQGLKDLQHGEFGADMKIDLVNDGPVTIVIDTDEWKK